MDHEPVEREARPGRGLGPLLSGVIAAALVTLTLIIAVVLGMQEQSLVTGVRATATFTPPMPTATSLPLPATRSLPSSTPSPSPLPSPSPTPTYPPLPTVTPPCLPPADWREYTVKRGETLAILAWRFWTTEEALREGNCLEDDTLEPGQVLYVPDVATRVACGRPSGWFAYTVQRGDTLSSLAVRCNTSVARLKQANCLSGDTIYAGARLWLPCPIPTPLPPSRTPLPSETPTLPPETPTSTPTVTDTLQPPPTETETPTGTPSPTDTPPPTETGVPTDTPPPTDTPVPPTDTPIPPTDTPEPTATPLPPTDTPIPPTATGES